MAVTAIWSVKGSAGAVIKYTTNPAKTAADAEKAAPFHAVNNVIQYTADEMKTEQQFFVTGVNCSSVPEKAAQQFNTTKEIWHKPDGIVCFHAYQAFKPGEVTPEQAHEIGVRLAQRMWGDRFEVLVSTHLNTGKIHNHFALNSVSFKDGKKYYDQKATYARMRELSDELCREYGLSVIEEPKGKAKQYGAWEAEQSDHPTQRDTVREAIDRAVSRTYSFRDFTRAIQNDGYVLERRGSFLRIRPDEGRKFFRLDKLGEGYTEDDIRDRLEQNFYDRPRPPRPTFVYKKRDKAKGLYALYLHYMYLLGNLPESRPMSREMYVSMREDSKRLKMYSEESKMMAANHIVTAEDLHDFSESLSHQFKTLAYERAKCRNKLRRMHDSEAMQPIKDNIADLSERMSVLRKQMKYCEDIAERSGVIEVIVNTIEREHEPETKTQEKKQKEKER